MAHLFASRLAHPFVYRLLRQRLPMTLPRGVDRSTTEARRRGCRLFRRCLRLAFLRGLANCHWFPPWDFDVALNCSVERRLCNVHSDFFRSASKGRSVALAPVRLK